ncbi:MAG: EAL domain-containing protein [Cyanobacteria bacterium J06581_3]
MTLAISALLVEENLLDAQLFATLMKASSLMSPTLHHASNLTDAIATLSHSKFDVVLLNLASTSSDCITHVQKIKACVPQVPIVVISSTADRINAAAALQAGAQDYLMKPAIFSCEPFSRLSRVLPHETFREQPSNSGHVAGGNLLVTTLQNVVQQVRLTQQLAVCRERYALAQRQIQQLTWKAAHDPLTRLHNRANFEQALERLLADGRSPITNHVLCYLDLDRFKVINDTCGHAAGDQLLKQVAALWRSRIRPTDMLARLGGDEFGLLLHGCDIEGARQIAEALCKSLQDFLFSYNGKFFTIGVSIGIVAIAPDIGGSEELLKLADFACYQAKERGRSRIYVHDAITHQSCLNLHEGRPCPLTESFAEPEAAQPLPLQLTRAFDTNQFQLYQEVIAPTDTAEATIEHREVLIRLRNSHSGQLMPPMGFIPTAERYQLMPQIDRWVLQQVIRHVAKATTATSADLEHLRYSINLSAASLSDDSFVEFLQQQLSYHRTPASSLCFEITEMVAIANIQKTIHFTTALKSLGCKVALDNYGSSISSLTYLKQLPLDYLKIDGRFVKEAVLDPITFTMLAAIQQVAQAMQIKTVAKSVESKSILETVKTLGLDFVQGYEIGMSESLRLGVTQSLGPQCQSPSLTPSS